MLSRIFSTSAGTAFADSSLTGGRPRDLSKWFEKVYKKNQTFLRSQQWLSFPFNIHCSQIIDKRERGG